MLVSFERKMNALYKCVKIKILWTVSVWLVLESRVTIDGDMIEDFSEPHFRGVQGTYKHVIQTYVGGHQK